MVLSLREGTSLGIDEVVFVVGRTTSDIERNARNRIECLFAGGLRDLWDRSCRPRTYRR